MSDHDLDAQLAAVPLFADLSKRQRRRLLDGSQELTHDVGREIAAEGKGALAMRIVLEGAGEVSIRGKVVRTLGPGDYFGEISLIDGKPRSATVTATETMKVLAIEHHAFDKVLDDDPTVARTILVTLCARLREAEARSD